MAVSFGGRTTRIPSVLPRIDTTGLVRGGITASGIIGVIGTAGSGPEDEVQEFRLPSNARDIYIDGPLLDAAEAAWGHGAQIVRMLRIGSGVASSTITLSGSAGSGDELVLESIQKGDRYNDIQVKVEVGDDGEPSRKITLQLYNAETNRYTTETFEASSTQLIADAINTPASAGGDPSILVTATVVGSNGVLDTSSYANMTGGNDGIVNNTVIQSALSLMEAEDVNIVIFDEEIVDATSHALLNSHCQVMSNLDKERICLVGHDLSDPIGDSTNPSSIVGRAVGLNSDRAVMVSPGTDGRSAAYTAAKVAGLLTRLEVAEPLTFKGISANTIETTYTRTELEKLIQFGVCAIEDARAGRRVARGITTIQDPSSVTEDAFKEVSVRRIVDLVVDTIRTNLEATYIGRRGVVGVENAIGGTVQGLLLRLKEDQVITDFRGIDVERDPLRPDAFKVVFEVAPTFPINFIFVDFKLQNVIV